MHRQSVVYTCNAGDKKEEVDEAKTQYNELFQQTGRDTRGSTGTNTGRTNGTYHHRRQNPPVAVAIPPDFYTPLRSLPRRCPPLPGTDPLRHPTRAHHYPDSI